jgi:hypothetical protein
MSPFEYPLVAPDDHGIRPAGPPDACFYCKAKVGQRHGPRCEAVRKKVWVRYSFELEVEVPRFWEKTDVEFWRNESSSCAINALRELTEFYTEDTCPCPWFNCEYIREMGEPEEPEEPDNAA